VTVRRSCSGRWSSPIPEWEPAANGRKISRRRRRALRLAGRAYEIGPGHVYVELDTPEQVAALHPDLVRSNARRATASTASARDGGRWKDAHVGPAHGVAEDPATGSAAGPLAIHLARHGRIAFASRSRSPVAPS